MSLWKIVLNFLHLLSSFMSSQSLRAYIYFNLDDHDDDNDGTPDEDDMDDDGDGIPDHADRDRDSDGDGVADVGT